ncbi:tRNA adenosine(34) deaminase TadA [Coxiella endosymbiont of Rhipicephalus microplus]|uniref:tRNA adenosine(34) deaminase TadA n=1 Tax=Coxiella endosymbiont of Rhipicephalus microplus TaxID=1656186 RepID=UPI000C8058F4|nr:tRNA adenosine(34) deaminase TadA [Coxiella endosymbiont of Rhipicephalus microplus]PMB54945.1 tRNA-specific adenosine-34 deaminase [Coxiella-like endosymbiont]
MIDKFYIQQALLLAKQQAEINQEVPVGAVLVKDNEIIGKGFNNPIGLIDPTAHAELLLIREAAKNLGNYRLVGTTLYVTLEPCAMCLGAMIYARIHRLVFGAFNLRGGAVKSVFQLLNEPRLNHRISWTGGILADECAHVLKNFFKPRR